MAAASSSDSFTPDLYLSPDQQNLLLAALSSNNPNRGNYNSSLPRSIQHSQPKSLSLGSPTQAYQDMATSVKFPQLYDSPLQHASGSSDFGADLDNSPFLDYDLDLDADRSFDLDMEGQMIGSLPESLPEGGTHDKRKLPDSENDDDEGGGKRREGEEKVAKKPGRKPLTSEPTSLMMYGAAKKRKAQNRAAQRAFRERKEKHLKDLETKVADLEKASESANHENSLLRAQVGRLQTEVKEYRRRLHLNGGGIGRTPSVNGIGLPAYLTKNSLSNASSNFSFEFPRFGAPQLSAFGGDSLFYNKTETTPVTKIPGVLERPALQRVGSTGSAGSSGQVQPNRANSATSVAPRSTPSSRMEDLADLFSPSILSSVSKNSPIDYMSASPAGAAHNNGSGDNSTGLGSTPHPNNGSSISISASPSASSVSQRGPDSSCGTTPEPTSNSPAKSSENPLNTINEERTNNSLPGDEISFCEKLNMACGNSNNPIPRAMSQPQDTASSALKTPASDVNRIDLLPQQNGGQLDPIIFGEYRDTQDMGDFGGFFDDAFPLSDLVDPFNNDHHKCALPELEDGFGEDEEVVPGEDPTLLLNCNRIWERLQTMPNVASGQVDLEDLCSELRRKARCSESGVVVNEKDFNSIVSGLPQKHD
ncbi:hypothetical protein GP486_005133 [Trichoglossum hirsutum]|uniref:BZIP domain-containing protein n=1 Tax=Trichoglossum hirsutum TaxID=265104 RepID=A0A9P8RNA6_9PEZI|nr:hypothetical protein GP486_005133 [Trichoglossum hirsutum]